jgi:CheY-like chemotaxis protein
MPTDLPTRPRILIIDDDPRFRALVRLMLTGAGYELEEAQNGEVGLGCYRRHPSAL